jgi:hypothetical protein
MNAKFGKEKEEWIKEVFRKKSFDKFKISLLLRPLWTEVNPKNKFYL